MKSPTKGVDFDACMVSKEPSHLPNLGKRCHGFEVWLFIAIEQMIDWQILYQDSGTLTYLPIFFMLIL